VAFSDTLLAIAQTNWGNALHGMGSLREAVLVYRDAVGAASEEVELEATEALAATLTTLEQEEREQRQVRLILTVSSPFPHLFLTNSSPIPHMLNASNAARREL